MKNDAKTDLAYIRELMLDTRRAACLSGGYFIVWGIAVGAALLVTWLQLTQGWTQTPFITWTACFVLGSLGNLYLVRQEMREPVQAPAGRLIGMVWVALGITQLILFFAGLGTGAIPGQHMPALFCALIGTGVFLTGVLAGYPWLRNLAFGWWLGSVVMFVWPGMYVLLLMSLMLLVLYVVPGTVLIRMKQRHQAAAGV